MIKYFTISLDLKSGLIRGMAFGGRTILYKNSITKIIIIDV